MKPARMAGWTVLCVAGLMAEEASLIPHAGTACPGSQAAQDRGCVPGLAGNLLAVQRDPAATPGRKLAPASALRGSSGGASPGTLLADLSAGRSPRRMALQVPAPPSFRPEGGKPVPRTRNQPPLKLEEVLDSVQRNYPPLLVALQDIAIANADVLSAMGRFDLTFRSRLDLNQLGFYSSERFDFGVEQPVQFGGATFFSGWRVGQGRFAPYEGLFETRGSGELRVGARLPLVRDRAVDSRRADLRKAEIGRAVASLSVDQQKLFIIQAATRRFWDWVAAGQRFDVSKAILEVATSRDSIIRETVQLGQIAAIEIIDNQRAILQRRSQLVEAERFLQATQIELSLFYRDAQGNPVLVSEERLPEAFPEPADIDDRKLAEDIDRALDRRPEIKRLDAQRDQIRVDQALFRNQILPGLDLVMTFTQESNSPEIRRGPQELKGGIVFDLPFQRRSARGRLESAEARLQQIEQRTRFQRDQIRAEVQDAVSAVRAAFQRVQVIRDEVGVTRELEQAERVRFDLGDSTLFVLNLREQATFDAEIRLVAALADYYRALASYELAIARALETNPARP